MQGVSRIARLATIVGLAVAALATALFTAWAIYTHQTFTFRWGFLDAERAGQSFIGRGLRILTQHEHFKPGAAIAIACVIISIPLVVLMLRGKRWPYLVTAIGAAAAIVPAWIVRSQVWDTEAAIARSAKWAERSPYVGNATKLAIAITISMGLLAVVAFVAWFTSRREGAAEPPAG